MKILVTALVTAVVTAGAAYAASGNGRLFHAQSGDEFIAGKKIACFYGWPGVGGSAGFKCGLLAGHSKNYPISSKLSTITNDRGVTIIVGGKPRYVCRTDGSCATK